MSSWAQQRSAFQGAFDKFQQYYSGQLQSDIRQLNQAMGAYVENGGVDASAAYGQVGATAARIQSEYNSLSKLVIEMIQSIGDNAAELNTNGLLQENGRLQQKIKQLQELEREERADAETAELRSRLLATRGEDVNRHQLFLLGRPLRPGAIPVLWVLSFAMFSVGVMIMWSLAPSMQGVGAAIASPFMTGPAAIGAQGWREAVAAFLGRPIVWGPFVGACLVIILFLSLKVAGKLP